MQQLPSFKAVSLAFLIACFSFISVSAQVGVGTNTPDASSMLDISSLDKGLLIPRVALTAANVAAPVTAPAEGLIVYNTAVAGTSPNNVVVGYYYWTTGRWYPVVNKGVNPGDMQYWDGLKWVMVPASTANNKVLTWCSGKPVWGPCIDSATIAPVNNSYEGHISSFGPTIFSSGGDQLPIATWTAGPVGYIRSLLRFDYSPVPPGAIIDSAKLLLFADLAPINGNLVDAHFGPTNSFTIQRITSNWTLPTPFTWNSPPSVTTTNMVTVPQSTSSFQDAVVDVTNLVQDHLNFGNNGFLMKLVTEVQYNIRQYSSSKEPNAARHPMIKIYWHM